MGKRRKRLTMKKYAKKYASVRRALGLTDDEVAPVEAVATPEPVAIQQEVVVTEVEKEVAVPEQTKSKRKATSKAAAPPQSTRETFHEIVNDTKRKKTTTSKTKTSKAKVSKAKAKD
jgi:hypothetical protein